MSKKRFDGLMRRSCTSVLVGRAATRDGSILIARNEDNTTPAAPKSLRMVPAGERDGVELVSGANGFAITLPEGGLRYSAMPDVTPEEGLFEEAGVNAAHVAMSATESALANDRVLAFDPYVENGLAEDAMLTVVLPYVKTAREGVKRLGEIVAAHGSAESNGVLFADELPEFNKQTLEVLRQPLEDHKITISRSKYTVEFPCSFMFIASMNPCPCGYYNDPTHKCCCTPGQIQRYMSKISGPLLDRIDIQCEITPVPFKDISKAQPGEPSAAIRERVIKARDIQTARYKDFRGVHCNAQMTERMIHQFAEPDEASIALLRTAMEKFSLSARAYNRILKVARTIADLDGSEHVEVQHISEAIGYRNLDRGDWAERRMY